MTGVYDDDRVKMSVVNEQAGRESKDIEITTSLKDNLFNTKIYLRPELYHTIMVRFLSVMKNCSTLCLYRINKTILCC